MLVILNSPFVSAKPTFVEPVCFRVKEESPFQTMKASNLVISSRDYLQKEIVCMSIIHFTDISGAPRVSIAYVRDSLRGRKPSHSVQVYSLVHIMFYEINN